MQHRLDLCHEKTESLRRQLVYLSPAGRIRQQRLALKGQEERLQSLMQTLLTRDRHRLEMSAAKLESLSPLKRLGGGYAFVTQEDGKPLLSVHSAREGEGLKIRMRDGTLMTRVTEILSDDSAL